LIDLHCHILPGVDDGPASVSESIAMAEIAVADGISTIVATPHTLNGKYTNSLNQIREQVVEYRKALAEEQFELDVRVGSDAQLTTGFTQKVLDGEIATVNETGRYVLIEFPFYALPTGYKDEIFQLKLNDITPILTHPERYPYFHRQFDDLYDLISMGCLMQITAMSVTGGFGDDIMDCAHKMLTLRLAHIIATDAHSADKRPPILSTAVDVAIRILGNEQEAFSMVRGRPCAILEGRAVEVPEPVRGRRRWWDFSF